MFSKPIAPNAELRPVEVRHCDEIFAVIDRNRPHIRRWMGWVDATKSVDDVKRWHATVLEQVAKNNGFHAAIWWRDNLVGMIGFHAFDWVNKKTSIGYWLDQNAQGHGLMTAATRAMTLHALADLKLHRVEIRCAPENHKSRAIPKRLGFTEEGRLREVEWLYDHFGDLVCYSLLENEIGKMEAGAFSASSRV
jgi:ribosomal-protein-serine acetyltransferase